MELIGSLFLILAVALVVGVFISRPFLRRDMSITLGELTAEQKREHLRSSLLAERDRILTALQELDFDNALGKIPAEDYPEQRNTLKQAGAEVLRRLDALEPQDQSNESNEDRIEAAVAARRADTSGRSVVKEAQAVATGANGKGHDSAHGNAAKLDSIEDLIASRKRERSESSAGFCPKCGRPVQKSDKFCSKCGASL